MHDEQVDSDPLLVRQLLADQFPQWAELPIRRVLSDGTDNALYRLGDDLVARLPLIHWAVGQAEKELAWLPRIAARVPLAIPEPLVIGEPGHGYPWKWSVYRWIDGENALPDRITNPRQAARDLAEFVRALRALSLPDAPIAPRCGALLDDDQRTRDAIHALRDEFDADALTAIWEEAIAAPPWDGPAMCVHSDLHDGNVLALHGRLHAVIDFSAFGLGEPENDLDPAWGMFTGDARAAFRDALAPDDDTWARARGWAVKSVYGIVYYKGTNPGIVGRCRRRIAAVLEETAASRTRLA
jgi:aminoglycoside phosphotransferase (APT) family kinase protein